MRSLVSFGMDTAFGASFKTSESVVVERLRCAASCFRLTPSALDEPVAPGRSLVLDFRGMAEMVAHANIQNQDSIIGPESGFSKRPLRLTDALPSIFGPSTRRRQNKKSIDNEKRRVL